LVRTGGAGTANTFLAFALARLGHDVEILFTDPWIRDELDPSWAREYAERGVHVRRLEAGETVVPRALTVTHAVDQALRADPPDVVVAGDWAGPAYAALQLRELGLDYPNTAFVVYCHGTNAWVYEVQRKLRRSVGSFELEALEQASVELADVVVSPSEYMLGWMRNKDWKLPRAAVAPYFTRSAIDGATPERASRSGRVRRLVFFGRLEERKGIAPFIAALNGLDPDLVAGLRLVFLGRETPHWPAERVRRALAKGVTSVSFEADLDQPEAIALLKSPGTLAVMPSLVDNSPNVIYECLEHGIPFLASSVGGGPELVAAEDRARLFVEPTPEGLREGLVRALTAPDLPTGRPTFETDELFAAWSQVVATRAPLREPEEAAVRLARDEFVLVRNDGDELEPDCLETLARAQAASGADVVTCGVRGRLGKKDEIRLFLGEPRELGVIANYYGLLGLYRRTLLDEAEPTPETGGDADWVRLAILSLAGASIVSVPRPLVSSDRVPGSAATDQAESGAALAVVRAFERVCPAALQPLPRLTAGLAAGVSQPRRPPTLVERLRWIWEYEGTAGLVRRSAASTPRVLRRGALHARRLLAALPRRAGSPGSEHRNPNGPTIRASEGAEKGRREHDDGRDERDPELLRVTGRPSTLSERVIDERHEPQEREARPRQRQRDEQQQEVVHPDNR